MLSPRALPPCPVVFSSFQSVDRSWPSRQSLVPRGLSTSNDVTHVLVSRVRVDLDRAYVGIDCRSGSAANPRSVDGKGSLVAGSLLTLKPSTFVTPAESWTLTPSGVRLGELLSLVFGPSCLASRPGEDERPRGDLRRGGSGVVRLGGHRSEVGGAHEPGAYGLGRTSRRCACYRTRQRPRASHRPVTTSAAVSAGRNCHFFLGLILVLVSSRCSPPEPPRPPFRFARRAPRPA
jgi:hypothetical protein